MPDFRPRTCTPDECDRRIKAARARASGRKQRIETARIKYMDKENCPICNYRQKWNGIASHSAECINIDFESAKYYVSEYVKRRDKMRESAHRFMCEAQRWEGKCSILRHENNALRRKLENKESK